MGTSVGEAIDRGPRAKLEGAANRGLGAEVIWATNRTPLANVSITADQRGLITTQLYRAKEDLFHLGFWSRKKLAVTLWGLT